MVTVGVELIGTKFKFKIRCIDSLLLPGFCLLHYFCCSEKNEEMNVLELSAILHTKDLAPLVDSLVQFS